MEGIRLTIAQILKKLYSKSNHEFITELYRECLHREPDPPGLQHHLNLLSLGASKLSILVGIVQSEEAKSCLEKNISIHPQRASEHPSVKDPGFKDSIISMSSLGKNGRFGNQLFQYAFLKIYAKQHNLRVEIPNWIGQYLFGHHDPPISKRLPEVRQQSYKINEDHIPNTKVPFKDVNFWGYFQYHTKYYAPYKDYFYSLFQPVPEIESKVNEAMSQLRLKGKTIIGMHLRRGDYGYSYAFIAHSSWYKKWLEGLWDTLEKPVLFIASDELEKVVDDFSEFHPITSRDLRVTLPKASFYPDFYILSQCNVVAISNSTFSFTACMLNKQGNIFARPHLETQKLIPFDPWNSEVLLRNKEAVL